MIICSIDSSSTCPALYTNKTFLSFKPVSSKVLKTQDTLVLDSGIIYFYDSKFHTFDRIKFFMSKIEPFLLDNSVSTLVFEDYAFGGNRLSQLAEFTGIIKFFCFLNNIKVETVAIPTVKKQFSGFGRADKISMYQAFLDIHKSPFDISSLPEVKKSSGTSPTSDIIDAYAIFFTFLGLQDKKNNIDCTHKRTRKKSSTDKLRDRLRLLNSNIMEVSDED